MELLLIIAVAGGLIWLIASTSKKSDRQHSHDNQDQPEQDTSKQLQPKQDQFKQNPPKQDPPKKD